MKNRKIIFLVVLLLALGYYTFRSQPSSKPGIGDTELRSQTKAEKKRLGILWNYSTSSDPMGGTIKNAYILSLNEINFQFPYQGSQRATLTLRNHPRYGKDVILGLNKGQFLCGYPKCQVTVRFDNGKPQKYSAAEPADHSTNTLFINGYAKFLENLKKSKKLYIEAIFYQEGSKVFEFDIEDLAWD